MNIVISSSTHRYIQETALKTHPATKARSRYYMLIMQTMYGKICREHIPFDEFMEIPANYWRKVVGTHYSSYLKELMALEIIEVDNSYSTTSNTSKKYRLNQSLAYSSPILLKFNDKAKRLHNTKDPLISQTIKNLQRIKTTYSTKAEMYAIVEDDINYSYLVSKGLRINYIPDNGKYYVYEYDTEKEQNVKRVSFPMEAKKIWYYILEEGKQAIFWKSKIYLTDDPKEWVRRKIIEIQHYYLQSLEKLKYIRNRKNITCSRNDVNRRLDTNLTNAPSIILKYIRIDGEPLKDADLSNSQLSFYGILSNYLHRIENIKEMVTKEYLPIDYNIDKDTTEVHNIVKYIVDKDKRNSSRGICYSITDNEPLTSGCISIDCSDFLGVQKEWFFEEIASFRKLCFSGRFYEEMAALLYDEKYKDVFSKCSSFRELQRKMRYAKPLRSGDNSIVGGVVQVRPNVITLGKNKEAYTKEYKAIRADVKILTFQTIFSSYRYSNDLKRVLKEKYPAAIFFIDSFKKEYGSNQFSILLQLLESSVFIDGIYKECLNRGITVFSKHDSILFRPSDGLRVRKIILGELNRFFGRGNYKVPAFCTEDPGLTLD